MKEVAHDYIIKDRLLRLPSAVINSVEKYNLEKEQQAAGEMLAFHIENTPATANSSDIVAVTKIKGTVMPAFLTICSASWESND